MRQKSIELPLHVKFGVLVFWTLLLLIFVSLIKNLGSFVGLDDRLISLEAAVVELRVENNELSSQAESVLAGNMDEQLIRGELGLAQPGETVVIIPDDLLETDEVALPDSEDEVDHRPVWRKWFELLF